HRAWASERCSTRFLYPMGVNPHTPFNRQAKSVLDGRERGRGMSRFIENAIVRAGLADVIPARRSGDFETVRRLVSRDRATPIDLLVLGALADMIRAEEAGEVVRV